MITVVKIGGNVVENEELLEKFCADFAALEGPKVLVHGGGVMASRMQKQMGQEPVMVEGRRVTDDQTLRTVTMVYAGWCNKHITALLQKNGCNACGLAGCDASLITAKRRAPRTLLDGVTEVDYGFVGDVSAQSINVPMLEKLLSVGIVPVFSAINHDGQGNLLNTNADTMASSLAVALGACLVYCFEKKGVLLDCGNEDSVIPKMTPDSFDKLKTDGVVADGMIPKLENSFKALREGACSVRIIHASSLLKQEEGTTLSLQ